MKLTLPVIAFLAVSGFTLWSACPGGNQLKDSDAGSSPIAVAIDSDFQLDYNRAATLGLEELAIKFLDVAEDSRCPVGVQCVWQGQAKIDLEIKRHDEKPENIQLTSLAGEPKLAEKNVGGYNIRLVKVEPPRTTDRELKPADYKITLNVSRTPDSGE